MDYFSIVKKAFTLPWKYRFLFWLGVLASFAAGGGGGQNFTSYSTSSSDWQNLFKNNNDKSSRILETIKNTPRVLGTSTDKLTEFISHNIYWIVLVILVLILIGITLLIFGTFARAGIIRSIPRLEKNQACNFKSALWDGKRFFWRIVGAGILTFLFFIVLIAVLTGIAVSLFIVNVVIGFIWLIPAILILIITAIYVGLVVQFWSQIFIVEDKGVIANLKPAINLVNTHFKEVIIFWLINILVSIIYTVAIAIVIFVIVLPLVLLAVGVGFANLVAGIIVGVVGFLVIYLVVLAVLGYYTASITSYWTLAYLEIRKIRNPKD